MTKIKAKQFWDELTEKQQNVIDAKAEAPDRTMKDVADIAECDDGYVSKVLNRYENILEERKKVKNNRHRQTERGNVTVEGEIDVSDVQHITERPYNGHETAENGTDDTEDGDGITVELTEAQAFELVTSDAPEELRREIFNSVRA